jgi:hypothetical protein
MYPFAASIAAAARRKELILMPSNHQSCVNVPNQTPSDLSVQTVVIRYAVDSVEVFCLHSTAACPSFSSLSLRVRGGTRGFVLEFASKAACEADRIIGYLVCSAISSGMVGFWRGLYNQHPGPSRSSRRILTRYCR